MVVLKYLWPFWLGSIWKHQSCSQGELLPHYCQTWWLVSQTLGVRQIEANVVIFFFLSLCHQDHNIAVCASCFWAFLERFTVGRCTLSMMLWLVRVIIVLFSSTKIGKWLIIYPQEKLQFNTKTILSVFYSYSAWVMTTVMTNCVVSFLLQCVDCSIMKPFKNVLRFSPFLFLMSLSRFYLPRTSSKLLTGLRPMDFSRPFHHAIFSLLSWFVWNPQYSWPVCFISEFAW